MARTRTSKRRSGSIAALVAVFAIVCGVVLLLAGPTSRGELNRVENETRRRLTTELVQMLATVQQAEQALNDANYGQSRRQIERVRSDLSRLLAEINEATVKENNETEQ